MNTAIKEIEKIENHITPFEKLKVCYQILRKLSEGGCNEADDLIGGFVLLIQQAYRRGALKHYL